MMFEKISVQEAFGFLSLLGEVGGFMGLLLGASVMTILESIDFIILAIYKAILKRGNHDPGKSDTVITQANAVRR